jgi:hypothetical protein
VDQDGDGLVDFGYGIFMYDTGNGPWGGPLIMRPGPEAVGAPGIEDWYDAYAASSEGPVGSWVGSPYIGT